MVGRFLLASACCSTGHVAARTSYWPHIGALYSCRDARVFDVAAAVEQAVLLNCWVVAVE